MAPEAFIREAVGAESKPLYLWGCLTGGGRERTWEQIGPRDFVVFVQAGRYAAVARATAKTRSAELSHALWREDNGEPFELIYSLTKPAEIDIGLSELGEWLPAVVRGFMRVGSEKMEAISQEFGSIENFVKEKLLGTSTEPITWWVNQGRTYLQERDGGYMWAPKLAKNGRPQRHWTTMTQVQPGDRIVHYKGGAIRAVSRANSSAEDATRPVEISGEAWGTEGWLVRTGYTELAEPMPLNSIASEWRVPESGPFDVTGGLTQGYLSRLSTEFGEELARMLSEKEVAPPDSGPSPQQDDPLAGLVRWTYLEREQLEELIELLQTRRQIIFQGSPGSGKTWVADAIARHLTENPLDADDTNSRLELVQFHQSYGYEDFMQGIRPVTTNDGHLEYHVQPGILMRFIGQKDWDPEKDYVIVIDEINRGNISRIFGELLLLLEYREKQVRLPYADPGEAKFRLPSNLLIIGTMNTADRSLASIDYALRRRFAFHRLSPVEHGQAPVLKRWLDAQSSVSAGQRAQVLKLFLALNRRVEDEMGAGGEDFQIGHSYFMTQQVFTEPGRARIWRTSLRPLLEEYFANRKERAQLLDQLEPEALLSAHEVGEPSELEIEEDAE